MKRIILDTYAVNSNSATANLYDQVRSILTAAEFDPHRLLEPVENIRKSIGETLWKIVTSENQESRENLLVCLDCVRNYFMLGKGELFLALIDKFDSALGAANESAGDRNAVKNKDLHLFVEKSFAKLCEEFADLSSSAFGPERQKGTADMVTLKLNCSVEGAAMRVDEIVDHLELELTVGARLRPIFAPELLESCNRIFRFLFKVRYLSVSLFRCWTLLMKNKSNWSVQLVAFLLARVDEHRVLIRGNRNFEKLRREAKCSMFLIVVALILKFF